MNALIVRHLRRKAAFTVGQACAAGIVCTIIAAASIEQACGYSPPSSNSPPAALSRPSQSPDISVEDEVLGNVRRQAIGPYTVADLNIPEAFLRREADRIIRASFEQQFRIVVRDPAAKTEDAHLPAGADTQPATLPAAPGAAGAVTLHEPSLTEGVLQYRRSFPIGRPPNRGFTPRLSDAAAGQPPWPFDAPGAAASQAVRDAADLVARRLAFDGLLPTLARAVAAIGPESFRDVDEEDLATLREIGLPVDLLRYFTLPNGANDRSIIEHVAAKLTSGNSIDLLLPGVHAATFRFQPTRSGFRIASESGEETGAVVRAQATRGGYWKGEGDGGNADLLRQAIAALPQARCVVSIEIKHARGFVECANTWPLTQQAQLTIVPEALPVAQWTHDNAKPGVIAAADGSPRLAMLVPRYASWGDDGSAFVPGETFLLPGVAEAIGAELIRSPLLFQGGNTLCVTNPKTGQRMLLVGDADVWRNTALGLTLEQTLQAFATEFGVDRCEMLPAVSFHLDYDVSVRAVGDQLVALVNDPVAAAVVVLETGTAVLQRAGILDGAAARQAIDALHRGEHRGFLQRVAPIVYSLGADGHFALSLAEQFSTSPVDSGVGNLQRFLLAMDLLVSLDPASEQMSSSRHAASYLQSLRRREVDRAALHQRLRDLGMIVVPVPGMSDATRSITAINGIHLQGMFLMPAYGGLYGPVDEACLRAVRRALGETVRIVPIVSGESQRRCGAVHCSLSVFPRLP